MAATGEVVIIGGGVAGCSVAYHLALAGVRSTVIEREGIGSQASGFSAGGLNPLEGAQIPGPLGPLAMESFRMHRMLWNELKDETGIDCEARIISLVKVAFQETGLPELQQSLDAFSAAGDDGFAAHWLDRQQLTELEPRISPDVIRGLLARGNAALDSYRYTQALAAAAEKRGATIRSGTVNGVKVGGGRVTGVFLGDTDVPCDCLVLAAGPWSREAETWLDCSIPVDPLKGEILRMDLPGPRLEHDFSGGGGSVYSKPDGMVWCGTTEERQGFDRETTEAARRSIFEGAVRIVPDLARATLALQTACLRPVTPDWLPIVGQAPGWDNVYLTTGAGKKGILLSTGMGKATADLITRGATSLSIGPCDPARFRSGAGSLHTGAERSAD
jgi:glycine oxidase